MPKKSIFPGLAIGARIRSGDDLPLAQTADLAASRAASPFFTNAEHVRVRGRAPPRRGCTPTGDVALGGAVIRPGASCSFRRDETLRDEMLQICRLSDQLRVVLFPVRFPKPPFEELSADRGGSWSTKSIDLGIL